MAGILAHTDRLLGRLAYMTGTPAAACCNIHQRDGWSAAAGSADVRISGLPLSSLAQRRLAALPMEHDDPSLDAALAAWHDALDLLEDIAPAHADTLRTAFGQCYDALLAAAWRDGWNCANNPALLAGVHDGR